MCTSAQDRAPQSGGQVLHVHWSAVPPPHLVPRPGATPGSRQCLHVLNLHHITALLRVQVVPMTLLKRLTQNQPRAGAKHFAGVLIFKNSE